MNTQLDRSWGQRHLEEMVGKVDGAEVRAGATGAEAVCEVVRKAPAVVRSSWVG